MKGAFRGAHFFGSIDFPGYGSWIFPLAGTDTTRVNTTSSLTL
jgi:hypothetical protein